MLLYIFINSDVDVIVCIPLFITQISTKLSLTFSPDSLVFRHNGNHHTLLLGARTPRRINFLRSFNHLPVSY